jgi:hypothetical protein
MEQFKLTVYAAGPIDALAERLGNLIGGTTVIETTGYWDSGIGLLKEPAAKIETLIDPTNVFQAIDQIEEWLDGSNQTAVLVEVTPTFARSVYRETD